MKVGTDNLETIANFTVDLGLQSVKVLSDGKVTGAEALGFLPIGLQIPTFLRAIPFVAAEITDLQEDEKNELINNIASRLKTENLDAAAAIASKALALLYTMQDLGREIKTLKAKK